MALYSTMTRVEAPRARVFEVFTDLERAADRLSGIEKLEILTEGPIGVGTRFRETRIVLKREAVEEMEITRFEPERRYTVEGGSCGCVFSTTFEFEERGGATEVSVEMQARPVNFMAKVMAPVTNLMMGGTLKKCFDRDLEELKAVAEGA